MKTKKAVILFASLGLGCSAYAADAASTAPKADAWGIVVPSYIAEASLTTKVTFDNNVYGTETNLAGRPELAEKDATVFTLSPKLSLNGVSLLALTKGSAIKTFTFGYTGEYNFFSQYSSETNARHTLPISFKLKDGAWSFAADNSFLYVQGSKHSPLYNTYSAYATATVRERRNQIQDRFSTNLRYDQESYFVRGVGSVLYYDLLVDNHNPIDPTYKGYQNWVNRSDKNVGLDFGFKQTKDLSLLAGWRLGEQTQDRYPWGGNHSESTYNRLLLGFEGKLLPWLQGSALVGPDFRKYSDSAHLGLVGTSHTWLYAEGNLTAIASDSDTITASTKVWHWVSSTGVAAYQDAAYALTWKHNFSKQLAGNLGVKFSASKYDYPTVRNDQLYSLPIGVSYSFSKELVVSADYQYSTAKNRVSNVTGREYNQNLLSVGLKVAF